MAFTAQVIDSKQYPKPMQKMKLWKYAFAFFHTNSLSPFEGQEYVFGLPDLSPAQNLNKNVQKSMQATQ